MRPIRDNVWKIGGIAEGPDQYWVDFKLGGDHGCALTNIGYMHCWGDNTYGQLGDGTSFLERNVVSYPVVE